MWSRNGRGTKFRIPKSIYKDGIVDKKKLKDLLQNKSGCSDDLKMSISREEIIAAIRSIEEGKHLDQINIIFVRLWTRNVDSVIDHSQ